MTEVNINLSISKSNDETGSHQNYTMTTNNIEEIRRVLNALNTVQPNGDDDQVSPEEYMPYGDSGCLDIQTVGNEIGVYNESEDMEEGMFSRKSDNKEKVEKAIDYAVTLMAWVNDVGKAAAQAAKEFNVDPTPIKDHLKKLTPNDIRRIAMKDSKLNNSKNKLHENFGDTNTYIAFNMMDETINNNYEGKRNPYSIHQAAEEISKIYSDHMGLTEKEAIDWLSSLYYNERMKEFNEEGGEFGIDPLKTTPMDVFNDIPNMPKPGTTGYEDEIGYTDDDLDLTDDDLDLAEPLGMPDEPMDADFDSGMPEFDAFESLEEDADFDYRDEGNGPRDPNSYDRERDIMDFAKKGFSKKSKKIGGPGDNTLPDPDEEERVFENKMVKDWEEFKTKKSTER